MKSPLATLAWGTWRRMKRSSSVATVFEPRPLVVQHGMLLEEREALGLVTCPE